jgi:predicted Fe-Mo cluster-binding NifX family protein/NAD-dependent dihydropyrimidine dehydrogenase PreA subunit
MKVVVTAQGPDIDAQVDPRFGRCACFVFVETDDLSFEAEENPSITLGGGAGIQSAQLMSQKGVQVVLTGNVGPNAYRTLEASGIRIVTGTTGTVRQAVEAFKAGGLTSAGSASVPSHSGMSGGGGGGMGMGGGMGGGGGGRGMGMGGGMGGGGGGRGMGMGGGMGRGGGGRGMGMGGGGGMGGGMGRGAGMGSGMAPPRGAPSGSATGAGSSSVMVAVVDKDECTGCGICVEACQPDAISVDEVAEIDNSKCTGCVACIPICPEGALSLHKR